MPRPKMIKITKDGQEGQCLESSVAAWERHGWTRTNGQPDDDGNSETSSTEAETEPESDAPAKKTATRRKAQ